MNHKWLLGIIIGSCLGIIACDEDSTPSDTGNSLNLCEKTGGTLDGSNCICGGETCQDAKWCAPNGKCSTDTEITSDMLCVLSGGQAKNNKCVCDGVECDDGVLCNLNTKKCPQSQPAQVTFADLCIHSGGTMLEDKCKCGDETCETNKICDSEGKCSNNVTPDLNTTCTNDEDYVGWLNKCTGSDCQKIKCEIDVDGQKIPVSCKGNQCGECHDYVSSCENNEDGNGVVSMCRGGQKNVLFECNDGNSCLKKDCAENGCANEILCGECHDGKFICKNGNVPENTKLEGYENIIDVPAGTITGMRSKCIDGKWTSLALDDRENCFFGYLDAKTSEDFAKYPQITVNDNQIVTVWNYSSNGQVANKYSLAACSEDGENCGECAYSFSYCSGQKWYTCNKGKVLEMPCQNSDNGFVGCYSSNSCYQNSTESYCKGTSCQNCKSICNWSDNN